MKPLDRQIIKQLQEQVNKGAPKGTDQKGVLNACVFNLILLRAGIIELDNSIKSLRKRISKFFPELEWKDDYSCSKKIDYEGTTIYIQDLHEMTNKYLTWILVRPTDGEELFAQLYLNFVSASARIPLSIPDKKYLFEWERFETFDEVSQAFYGIGISILCQKDIIENMQDSVIYHKIYQTTVEMFDEAFGFNNENIKKISKSKKEELYKFLEEC